MADRPEADAVVVVEIPRGSRNKYEWDSETGTVRFDRRLVGALAVPADYGFVPGTRGEDGEALDALVLLDEPTFPGVHVPVRVLGLVTIATSHGPESKLVCAADGDPTWSAAEELEGLPQHVRDELRQFFDNYKDFGSGNPVQVEGMAGRAAALAVLQQARRAVGGSGGE